MPLRAKPLESWWTVHENGCWIWIGGKYSNGYAAYHKNGKSFLGHRFVYETYKQINLPKEIHLDHLCKTKNCVNPNHLEPVTSKENTQRAAKKLSMQKAIKIKRLYTSKEASVKDIMSKYNIASQTVYAIIGGVRWK